MVIKTCPICVIEFKTDHKEKKFCSLSCRDKSYLGKKASLETKIKMSRSHKGIIPVNVFKPGVLHPFWVSDRSKIQFIETPEYKELRIRVLKRDDYSCQKCGARGKAGLRPKLEIHHLKSRKLFPELSLDERNCVVLCRECHKKTDSFLNRWQQRFCNYTHQDPEEIYASR